MYKIHKYQNEASWIDAEVVKIDQFINVINDHRPETVCRVLYDDKGIYLRFNVKDRYIRCVAENYQDNVCNDSCVEFFVKPAGGKPGYMNFEFSANGTMLAYHVIDETRTEDGFIDYRKMPKAVNDAIRRETTFSGIVYPEIQCPVNWELSAFIPLDVFVNEFNCPLPKSGTVWTANFYKCGGHTSHPHWACWNPITSLNFHLPQCFSEIGFE